MAVYSSSEFLLEEEIDQLTDIEDELVLSADEFGEEESLNSFCLCGLPSTEGLISCSGLKCPIGWFHRQCVDLAGDAATVADSAVSVGARSSESDVGSSHWLCDFCLVEVEDTQPKTRQNDDHMTDESNVEAQSKPACTSSTQLDEAGIKQDSQKTTSKRRARAKFGSLKKSVKEMESMACQIVKEAVLQLTTNDFYRGTATGLKVIGLAEKVDFLSENFENSSKLIVTEITDMMMAAKDKVAGPIANTHILTAFHKYRYRESVRKACQCMLATGDDVLPDVTMTEHTFFQQYLLRSVLEKVVKECRGDILLSKEEPISLSVHDEQVLRYVAGYIPYSLHKKYRRLRSSDAKQLAEFLEGWRKVDDDSTHSDTFLEYTSVWLTFQNRGGLFMISDKVYSLFRSLEIVTRKVLAAGVEVGGDTIKDRLHKEICGSPHVQNMWSSNTEKLTARLSHALFSTLVNMWVKIRISSYVKCYVNILKRDASLATGKKKALRKELKKQKTN